MGRRKKETGKENQRSHSDDQNPPEKEHKTRTMMPLEKGLMCRAGGKAGQPVENPQVF